VVYAGGALIARGILYVCSDTDPCDRKAPKGFLKPYGGGHALKVIMEWELTPALTCVCVETDDL